VKTTTIQMDVDLFTLQFHPCVCVCVWSPLSLARCPPVQ
jgi:hypothetical protein